jgi:CHAT domain-containing protein/tetratricopeptide (TPR) repeat protein
MPDEPTSLAEVTEVVRKARAFRRQGRDAEALDAAELARRALSGIELPDDAAAADTLNLLGMTFFETGYVRVAEGIYQRALALVEALDPPDQELLESLLNNLGQARHRLGDLQGARRLLGRSVALREDRSPGSLALAFALDNLGAVDAALSRLDAAEALHRRALAIFRRTGGPFDGHVATALGNLSAVHKARRELDLAEAYRLRAFDIHLRLHGPAHPETLVDLTSLVGLLLAKGDQPRVDRLVSRMLSIGGPAPERSHRVLAEMLSELAATAFADFRLDLAERLCTRAVELLEALEGADAPETLEAVRRLANVERATSDLTAAERHLRRALDGFHALGRTEDTIGVLIDLGKIYRDRGAYVPAEAVLSDAVGRLRGAAGPDRGLLASALGNLAELHYEAGRYDVAEHTYGEALAAIGDPAGEVERPFLLHGRGLLAYHLGRYPDARELLDEARRLWVERSGPDHPFVATTLANLALLHWATGDVEAALAAFTETAATRDHDLRRILAVGSERKRLAYARDLLNDLHKVLSFTFAVAPPNAAVGRFAARLALERKGRVLDAVAQTVKLTRGSPDAGAQALADRLQAVRTEITGMVTPTPRSRRSPPPKAELARLHQEEERLEAELSHRGALLDPDLEPVTLESVQAALPADGALVDLLVFRPFDPLRTGNKDAWGEEHYAALVLRASGEPGWFDLGPAAEIDTPVDELRRLLRNRTSDLDECASWATRVEDLVVAPLREALGDAERLLVAPDGKLALMPFGFLRAGGRRLAVSYLTSGRELVSPANPPARTRGVVVVAAPDYDAGAAGGPTLPPPPSDPFADRGAFRALAGTKGEADDLAALLADVTVIEGPAATVEALRRVRHPAVLHIATHGFLSPVDEPVVFESFDLLPTAGLFIQRSEGVRLANPMYFAGLALAGVNKRAPGTSTGIVTAQELAGMDLEGTELVVLSACETGLGTVTGGEEFTGLRRALSIAGAVTQVTSLWKVDDLATRALMGHFYRGLVEGLGRAEALRIAQQQIEHDPEHPDWRHPFYWSAFVLSGASGPIPGGLARRAEAAGS